MTREDKIILDVSPADVLNSILQREQINLMEYDVEKFEYSIKKIDDKDLLRGMEIKEFQITHCRITLKKKG
jgi:hypothetical protein